MPEPKPNILVLVADQLSAQALKAYGNDFADTPNIDALMAKSARMENCYTPTPLCQPARAAFWTGMFPHQTGVLSNGRKWPEKDVEASVPTLGSIFSDNDYKCVHFGKCHDAGTLRGFEHMHSKAGRFEGKPGFPINSDTFADRYTTEDTVAFLDGYKEEKPYLVVADLNNPHNICGWVGENRGPGPGTLSSLGDKDLPALPRNFHDEDFETRPLPVQYMCCAHNRQAQTQGWDELKFRRYLAAYHHYLSRLDAEIGRILAALAKRSDSSNTLVVFFADHGDAMTAHGGTTKHTTFYEETTRVPFAVSGPGIAGDGRVASKAPCSLLDLLPTLCDLAAIPAPQGLWGRSLRPWLAGETDSGMRPHPFVVSEWHTEWGYTVEPGRMIRSERYKYMRYREGNGEELYDLVTDPGETRNLAHLAEHSEILRQHRALLTMHLEQTGDAFESMEWNADPRWRSHVSGYKHHRGPAAPEAG